MPSPLGTVLHEARVLLCRYARGTGYCVAFAGALTTAIALYRLGYSGPSREVNDGLSISDSFILESWLLLRLADNLFPFGRRWFL